MEITGRRYDTGETVTLTVAAGRIARLLWQTPFVNPPLQVLNDHTDHSTEEGEP
jgi:hypothetical protein